VTQPALAITRPDGYRVYRHPRTGEEVPSITTVLKHAIAKPALISWAAKMAAQYAAENWDELESLPPDVKVERIRYAHAQARDAAADTGDAVHEVIDAWSKGAPCDPPDKTTAPFMRQFTDFLFECNPQFLENEVTLWSRKHSYAGTADWIAEIDGQICLGDNKTGRRIYEESAIQVSALAGTDFIIREDGSEEEIPALEKLVVLHVRPRSWKLIPIGYQQENFTAFLAARTLLSWSQEVAPDVLGR
jgi:hypothetical protein